MRFDVSGRATIAGTATLPLVSLYATAAVQPKIMEIGLFNTTTTALIAALNRLTTAGTQGAGLTENCEDDPVRVAVATGFAGHTVAPTLGGEHRRASIANYVGAGIIWTWAKGLMIPSGTGNGVGIIVPSGTGQILDYYICWEE